LCSIFLSLVLVVLYKYSFVLYFFFFCFLYLYSLVCCLLNSSQCSSCMLFCICCSVQACSLVLLKVESIILLKFLIFSCLLFYLVLVVFFIFSFFLGYIFFEVRNLKFWNCVYVLFCLVYCSMSLWFWLLFLTSGFGFLLLLQGFYVFMSLFFLTFFFRFYYLYLVVYFSLFIFIIVYLYFSNPYFSIFMDNLGLRWNCTSSWRC